MNQVSLSFQGKQLIVFAAKDNIWLFQQKLEKLEFQKPSWELPNSERLFWETHGDINDHNFKISCKEMCQYEEDLHNLVNLYFLMTNVIIQFYKSFMD